MEWGEEILSDRVRKFPISGAKFSSLLLCAVLSKID
jgi:hypothetical protein